MEGVRGFHFRLQVPTVLTFATLPLPLRLLVVYLSAVVIAWCINWAIYSLAYTRYALGAWRSPATPQGTRSWLDWVPVVGWWRLSRESNVHGRGYWVRPFLMEVAFPLAIVWFYHFQTTGGTLPARQLAVAYQSQLHWQFLGYLILFALMTAATFIDFDEQTIPDSITIPGTLFGLLGSAVATAWLPLWPVPGPGVIQMHEIHAFTPEDWPGRWSGLDGLLLALGIISGWCFALLDRRWITRRGWSRAARYFVAGIFRTRWWLVVLGLWVTLCVAIGLAWSWQIERWPYLLSALLGLACAGGVTWAVRLIASSAMRVEALGFGDVTLMAMIGVFLGWQASLLVFFVAPLMAVLIFVLLLITTGRTAGAYGPYLCAGAAAVVVGWDYFLSRWGLPIFELGGAVILSVLAMALVLLGTILWIWRILKGGFRGGRARLADHGP
jgi:leader peptidase (prepilin peptidase) / N-methyltransferase